MGTYHVYLPVLVAVEDGKVTGGYIDYDGAPWMNVADEPNLWSEDEGEWMGTAGDDQLARVEEQAGEWVGFALALHAVERGELDELRQAISEAQYVIGSAGRAPLFGETRADTLAVLDTLADRAGALLDKVAG